MLNMNILIINHYAGSPSYGMEYRPYYLAREWRRLGQEVLLVAASNSHLRRTNPLFRGDYSRESIQSVNFQWLKTPAYSGNGIGRVRNMFEFVRALFKRAKTITKHFQPDVVIASSTYPLDIFPAYFIAKKANAKLIFEIHDLWPLSPMELGGYSKWHPFIIIMQAAENFAFRFSDKVVSILPNTLQHCIDHGLAPEKFSHIPNGFPDEQSYDATPLPVEFIEKINEQKKLGKFLLGYAGGHAISNALDCLIDAASQLDRDKFHVFLLGDGEQKLALQEKASKAGACVTFFNSVPKSQVNDFLTRMDALYLGWRNLPLYRFGISPNKLVDYLLSGRMVIHATNAPNDLVAEAKAGISIPAEDSVALMEAVKNASLLTKNERADVGNCGREYALKNLSYSKLAKDFISVLKS